MNTKEWDGCRNPSGAGVKLWMGLKSVKSGWNEHFFGRLALPRIWISSWMGHMACRSCVEELEVAFCSSFLNASIMNCREVFVLSSFHISQPQQARFVVTTVTLQCIEQHCWVDGRQFQWGRKRKTFFWSKLCHCIVFSATLLGDSCLEWSFLFDIRWNCGIVP